ncbi:MAG: UDP-2,4-diacetamido-2,4,6-trideoxy-beta-L-altropyranose hydrolase [Lachnospiraceae bacterium]|nr:UDP-2,4-diacetamido-2,4,6-trideoxy-beta-L-altropyranose hydrolase [Lachnospiraceae bacterium]
MFIRADMNDTIATGHVMRCLAIADAVRALGEEVIFITADHEAKNLLSERGYQNIILNTSWRNMESELPALTAVLRDAPASKILIDSYQVTPHYLEELSRISDTAYLDDLNAFLYPVHHLICYACYWEKFRYKERYQNTKLYLGPQYTPLREEFAHCEPKKIKREIENVLIISGGTDPQDVLRKILMKVKALELKEINVVCGRYYKYYDQLMQQAKVWENVFIRKQVSDIKHYYDEADLVISAGGTSLYELCACGTPTISYSIADNQLGNVSRLDQEGLIAYLGDARCDCIENKLPQLIACYTFEERSRRSDKMQKYIAGRGAYRLAHSFLNENLYTS